MSRPRPRFPDDNGRLPREYGSMYLRLKIRRDQIGTWSVNGLPKQPAVRFDDLAEGLEYAKRECAMAPALIEFYVDDLYIAAYQEEGWLRQLCRPAEPPCVGIEKERAVMSKTMQTNDRPRRCDCLTIWHCLPFCRSTVASRVGARIASVFCTSQTLRS